MSKLNKEKVIMFKEFIREHLNPEDVVQVMEYDIEDLLSLIPIDDLIEKFPAFKEAIPAMADWDDALNADKEDIENGI